MELFATPGNPVPPDPIVSVARTRDGLSLRVARWTVREARGTITVAIGRSEFIENYFEIVRALLARRFDVIVFDWRGQGLSDREIAGRRRGHVSSFAGYHRDLLAIEVQILRSFAPRPWFALGHSMGAALLLDQAHHGTSPFERLILSAPMIGLPLPYLGAKRAVIRALNAVGFGTWFIPGGSERSLLTRGFEANVLTGDRRQFDRLVAASTQLPRLAVGSPTVRWLANAFALTRRFADPRYSVATTTPILIVAAGADRIVDTAATERFAIRLKAGRCVTIPNARHQVIMERDEMTAQFWAAFDAFIPGDRARPDGAAAMDENGGAGRRPRGLLKRMALRGRSAPVGAPSGLTAPSEAKSDA